MHALSAALMLVLALAGTVRAEPAPTLVFSVESWTGLYFEVTVHGAEVLYRCGPATNPEHRALRTRWAVLSLQPRESRALFADLEELGVASWRQQYAAPVLDGQSWGLVLQTDGKTIASGGANAQPDELPAVIDRVARIVKPHPFGFSGVISDVESDCRSYAGPLLNRIGTPAP